jgi:hypothetical protein
MNIIFNVIVDVVMMIVKDKIHHHLLLKIDYPTEVVSMQKF